MQGLRGGLSLGRPGHWAQQAGLALGRDGCPDGGLCLPAALLGWGPSHPERHSQVPRWGGFPRATPSSNESACDPVAEALGLRVTLVPWREALGKEGAQGSACRALVGCVFLGFAPSPGSMASRAVPSRALPRAVGSRKDRGSGRKWVHGGHPRLPITVLGWELPQEPHTQPPACTLGTRGWASTPPGPWDSPV